MLYSRLNALKERAAHLASSEHLETQPEVSAIRSLVNNGAGSPSVSEGGSTAEITKPRHTSKYGDPSHYYEILLESCERLFDNQIELSVFEDQIREMFGNQVAYNVFTIDKLIGSLIKQAQTVLSDPTNDSQSMLKAFRDERENKRAYHDRTAMEGNTYCIDWIPDTQTMTIRLLRDDDSDAKRDETLAFFWQDYIDTYTSDKPVRPRHGRPLPTRLPFLKRNMTRTKKAGPPPIVASQSALEFKVCMRTYRLFFVPGTEEALVRLRTGREYAEAARKLQTARSRRQKWWEGSEKGLTMAAEV